MHMLMTVLSHPHTFILYPPPPKPLTLIPLNCYFIFKIFIIRPTHMFDISKISVAADKQKSEKLRAFRMCWKRQPHSLVWSRALSCTHQSPEFCLSLSLSTADPENARRDPVAYLFNYVSVYIELPQCWKNYHRSRL